MTELAVLGTYALVLAAVAVLLRSGGWRRERVLTPIVLFTSIEVLAVWPALMPLDGSILERAGSFPALLGATGLLATVTAYVLCGGSQPDATRWRGNLYLPDPAELRSIRIGLVLLVMSLVVIGMLAFRGLPPMLTGGLSSLLDPVGNAEQAAMIKETRLALTKGHILLGESYAGQGVINAATRAGWQVAVVVATLYWSWKRSPRSIIGLLLVFAFAFVFLGSAGSRSPLIICLVAAVATLAIRYRFQSRQIVAIAVVGFSFVLFIMPLSKGFAGGETVGQRTVAVVERVSAGNGQNNAQIVRLIEADSLDIEKGGLFVERLKAMVPGVSGDDPFALRLTHLAYGGNSRTTGYSTPTQYGLLYADGGAAGVLAGYVLSGVVLAWGWRQLNRIDAPLGAAAVVVGAILLASLSVTGIHGLLSTAPIVALALIIVAGPVGWSSMAAAVMMRETRVPSARRLSRADRG